MDNKDAIRDKLWGVHAGDQLMYMILFQKNEDLKKKRKNTKVTLKHDKQKNMKND